MRVGLVDQDALDIAGEGGHDFAQPGLFHGAQDVGLDLEIPAVVRFPRLQHGASRRRGIAAALEDHRVKVSRFAVVVGVPFINDHIVHFEIDDAIGARAQRGCVLLVAGLRSRAETVGKLDTADDRRLRADESVIRIGRRRIKSDQDCAGVDRLHTLDTDKCLTGCAAGGFICAVLPGKDHVVGGHIAAVRPEQPLLQGPGDRHQVFRDTAIIDCRDLSGQLWHKSAIRIVVGQRFERDRTGVLILCATR